ncbi:GNAT family N-acetyltransferase [Actinomyces haliotis]|uniref:GNAT family N-acetyltransferase n=1 Tax=Actinomyces haliotis TaxID=1280843 RepID=UPI00188DF38B|nr:GNAT family N-acetyltransferase [Actinomyces haliotis]
MRIRQAQPDDVDVLSELSRRTFTQTFGHLYRPEDLAFHLEHTCSVEALAPLLADSAHRCWLAVEDDGTQEGVNGSLGGVVGYVLAGPGSLPHDGLHPEDGEIKRLYLLQGFQGSGRGAALMRTAVDWLLEGGPRVLWLSVWSENDGAQRFYRRFGFERAGEYLYPVGEHRDHELIFRRTAGATALG